ncbi:MAG: hypothetical protein ACREDR_43885 [Blastocatellia bacterium]
MNPQIEQVVPAIITAVRKSAESVTKTKLLKLLYLFDLEYFRSHRETFSGFGWKYYHLGPWAPEYDGVLQDLAERGVIVCSASSNADFDTCFLESPAPVEMDGLLPDAEAEKALRIVMNAWAGRSTPEILDHVYFHSEPMQDAERGEMLDFSSVAECRHPKYRRSSSGRSAADIKALRKKFGEKMAAVATSRPGGGVTLPSYDSSFYDFLAKLETDG